MSDLLLRPAPQSRPAGHRSRLSRRELLSGAGMGAGMLGLAHLLLQQGLLSSARSEPRGPLAPRPGHYPARAKAVIWLFMYGGPSAVDLFDPKPDLDRHDGQRYAGEVDAFFGKPGPLMRTQFQFQRHGKSGAWVCNRLPNLARCVDDIAFLRACRSDSNNHVPALLQMNSGVARLGHPSAGAWATYGLGTVNQDLPGFVVLYDPRGAPVGAPGLWGSGFLPAAHQGTPFRAEGSPVLHLSRAPDVTAPMQRAQLDLLGELSRNRPVPGVDEEALAARLESFELAYRMQAEVPELSNLAEESEKTRARYGLNSVVTRDFGAQLLLARRMVERGVRFIQVYSGGPGGEWDAHSDLRPNHNARCSETDQPVAALLTDLKERGLLDSTLVVWGGEFGRLPVSQGADGRDHNPHGFLTWMAGGGVRGGVSYGETDELGYRAAVNPVAVPDLHATILHLMGLDHQRLTYRHRGREYRLTDTSGRVVREILA